MKKSFERKLTGGNNTNAIYIEKYKWGGGVEKHEFPPNSSSAAYL